MKWLRCNNCYTRARDATESFALTKCGHIYCGRCAIEATKQCVICNAVNVPTARLQEPLEPNLSQYFKSMSESFSQLLAVSNFQEEQLRIVMKRFDEMEAKYLKTKDICYKIEYESNRQQKKYKKERESYLDIIKGLKIENSQLKSKLQTSQYSPFLNYRNNESNALQSTNQHTCQKRYQRSDSRVSFLTPVSTNTNSNSIGFASSNSDRTYLASFTGSDRTFRIPSSRKVPRSAGFRSSENTASTSSRQIPERLESLLISTD